MMEGMDIPMGSPRALVELENMPFELGISVEQVSARTKMPIQDSIHSMKHLCIIGLAIEQPDGTFRLSQHGIFMANKNISKTG